jgi:two-component system chemotaxis sensor kinase CheA
MNDVLQQFLLEARDFLQSIAQLLLALERAPGDAALMDALFRGVHTLKGNCGLFDFPDMFHVIHAAEDLMSEVREGRLAFSQALTDALLDAMDFVSLQLDDIEHAGAPGAGHGAASIVLADRLRALVKATPALDGLDAAPAVHPDAARSAQLETLLAAIAPAARADWGDAPLLFVEYTPEPECFFKGEDPLYQAMQLPGLVWRSVGAVEAWPALAELDPYRCNLVLRMITSAPRAAVDEHFRYVPEQVWIAPLPAVAPVQAAPDPALAQEAQAIVLAQRDALTGAWVAGRMQAAVATIRACRAGAGDSSGLDALDAAAAEALCEQSFAPVLAWLDAHGGAPSALASALAAAEAAPILPLPAAPVEAATADDAGDLRTGRRAEDGMASRVLKVDQAKVDRLMNLIGEMVVARNGLPYLAAKAEDQYGVRELGREIKAQHAVINRIVDEMQDTIMQVRMTPVSFVFQRFPRLVRDIARRLGKEVELELQGEATEADKNIIEALADPLVHIVRNALDHGIELPEVRRGAGKNAAGRLLIAARQESDRVVIEVADDGKGIDPATVRRKAYEKGLIDEAALERLGEQESVNLVFLPGFSTAEQVSDLSGRGVGMDAVRSAVEKLGGSVQLTSSPGQGSRLLLSLPLSMAVSNVMIVESGGLRYGVPMDLVLETVRVPASEVHTIKKRQAAVLRGRIVPLRSLNELLALDRPQRHNEQDEMATLVLRIHGNDVGLVVDDFCGVMEVILKPMSGILGSLATYAGSALMGDGSVLMVINPKELLE